MITPLFSEDTTPVPYEKTEFPQFLKDLRRFEIITLGAMPFVTLDTTLAFSAFKYVDSGFDSAYTPNPFAASTYSTDEQMQIIFTSLGVCACIGLTDFVVQYIKRTKANKRQMLLENDSIQIYKNISTDEDAVLIPAPDSKIPTNEQVQEQVQEIEE